MVYVTKNNPQFLFNSSGNWIAFRVGKYVFNTHGRWIGWLPWGDEDVVDTHGNYLGTIVDGDRFYRFHYRPYRGYPGYPGYPGYAGYSALPFMAQDIDVEKLEAS